MSPSARSVVSPLSRWFVVAMLSAVACSGGANGAGQGTGGDTSASGGAAGSFLNGGRVGTGGAVSGGGGTATGGAGMPASCMAPSTIGQPIGWASVTGKGQTGTTGGGTATPVTVTTAADLNSNAGGTAAKVIYVMGSLTGDFIIGSNKTIVGLCGAVLHGHVSISGSVNVIMSNLKIVGYAVGNCALDPKFDATVGCSSGADAISVLDGAHHIWFDHCDVSDGTDGNLDITLASDFVTVSWTKFHYSPRTDAVGSDSTGGSGHRYSNLVGGGDNLSGDMNALNVTWHHNWWAENVVERQPRVRYGKNHLFNNVWSSTGDNYCVRAGMDAQILVESSYFSKVKNPQEFNNAADQGTAFITATNNVYDATTGTKATGGGGTAFAAPTYAYTLDDPTTLLAMVQSGAGPK